MYVSEGKAKISLPRRARTPQPIDTKIGTVTHIHHITNHAKIGNDRMRGVVRAEGVKTRKIHFLPFFLFFFFYPYNYQ